MWIIQEPNTIELWNELHFEEEKNGEYIPCLKYWPFGAGIIFLILAHTVYKMWIIQEPNTLELWNKLHFEEEKNGEYIPCLKYWPFGAGIIFFLILAHSVNKMWIIQEPNALELWNKLHFEEKKNEEYIPCLKY